jgi:Flp pilus assembly protein TadB
MTKKPIDRLYGLPLVLILLLGLAKYLNLFPIPSWLFACILVWGAIALMVEAARQRRKG